MVTDDEMQPLDESSDREFGAASEIAHLQARLDSYMEHAGLRSTGKRRLVIHHFFTAQGHISLNELLQVVKRDDSSIGYATVYRTMRMLVEGGIAEEHKFSDGVTRYEAAQFGSHHDHLICVECGRIQEFEEPLIEELQARVARRLGFRLVDHRHELYGICSAHRENSLAKDPSG